MRKIFWGELAVSLVLVLLLAGFFQPAGSAAMSMLGLMAVSGALLAAFAAFAVFVWRERARDEREELHRLIANRAAFLAGAAVLLAGVIVQVFAHESDPWLIGALSAMILAKATGSIYGRLRK